MDPALVRGLLSLAAMTAGMAAFLAVIAYRDEIARALRRSRDRLLPGEPTPAPHRLADLAADLRRLHASFHHPLPGEPMARREATRRAYDDALVEACRALDVPDTLSAVPPGTDRDAARMVVEHRLGEAGLAPGGSGPLR